MAYAIKYLFKFESAAGTTREIRVLKDGYSGAVIQRPLGRAPMLKKQQNGPVHGTSLEFYAECNVDREFIEFYTSDPKAYRVDLYAGATLLWQGYITPELYSEPDIAPPYDVQVVATDGVGELKLYEYAAQGAVTLRTLLSGLLSRTGLGTDIYLISSLKAGSRGAGALLDMTINLDYMAGESCYDVLTYLLDTLHATITWWKGAWILSRETNVTFTSGKVRYFNTAGNSALLNDSVQVLGKMYANPAWPVGQLSTVIDPAKNRVTVQAPWHVVTCLRNPDMGSDADWTKAKNARYETDGYVLPVNINTGTSETAVISQATSMAGLRVPMSLSVKATGATSEISAQVTGAVLGVLLTYKVGNVTYHLVKGDDGAPVWQQGGDIGTYIPLRTRIDFQQQLATWDSSRIEAEELTIDNIPPFLQGTTFPAGTLTVYILGYCAKIYGAYLDVVLPKGYQDILRISNGARGEGGEVEIAIGRETADNAYYAAFLQGLLLDSGNLITSFSDANFSGGMDYLAFIARDYALSVALPRAKVTGTVYLESGIAAPPLVFTKGALNYWLQTWSWNLYEDELEIEGLTLPSASLTVESETILESTASASSSTGRTSGGGAPISPGMSMAAVQEWVNGQGYLSSAEAAFTYATITALNGVSGRVTTLEGRTNWDTYFGVDENGDIYVKKNGNIARNFYSWGAVSAGGLSSGGGSEGVSLAAVWASLKTNTDDYANEKINAYHIPIGSGLSVVNGLIVATNAGTITSVTQGTAVAGGNISTSGSVVTIQFPTVPNVPSWALASTKPSYAFSEITGTATISQVSGLQTALDAKANSTALADYVKLNPGAVEQTIQSSISSINKGVINLWRKGNNWSFIGFSNGDTETFLGSIGFLSPADKSAYRRTDDSHYYRIWDAGNDGATSGLDADLLDGQHGSYYAPLSALDNYLPLSAGSSKPLTDSFYIITGDTDKCIQFSYDTRHISGSAWRIVSNGTGSGDTNYLSFQTGGSTATATTWYNVLRLSMDNRYVGINKDAPAYNLDVNGSARVTTLRIGTTSNAVTSYLEWDETNRAWKLTGNFYATGWVSAGGVSSSSGSGGIDADAMWSLLANTDSSKKINVAHLPYSAGTGISISDSNVISLNSNEYYSATTSRTANTVLAAPNGSNGAATFRALVAADISNIETWISGKGYITSYTDTKNTTGADNTTSKIFLVGPTAQTTSNGSARTYSNSNCYASGGYLYSGGLQVLTSHQTLYNLVINNSAGTAQITYKPGTSGTYSLTLTKAMVGLGNVENTALSTWAGTTNITTLGTITSGTWNGSAIAWSKLSISAQNLYDTIGSTKYAPYNADGYLPLSGGTLKNANYGGQLTIWRDDSVNDAVIVYRNNTGVLGLMGCRGGDGAPYYSPDSGVTTKLLLHLGNYSSYALPLTGGTITGSSTIPLIIDTTATHNYIQFKTNNERKGEVGYSANVGMFMQAGDSTYISIADGGELKKNNTYTFYHSGNSNKSDVGWICSTLTADGDVTIHSASGNSPSLIFQRGRLTGADYTDCRIYNSSGSIIFENNGSGTTWTRRFIVTDDGKVGVGAITPSYNLDVDGTLHASGASSIGGNLSVTGNILPATKNGSNLGGASLSFSYAYANVIHPGSGNNLWFTSPSRIYFVNGNDTASGTVLGTWTTAGLGIGVTPSYKLHVSGTAFFNIPSFTGFAIKRATSGGSSGITFISADSSNYWNIGCDPSGGYAERFYWNFNNSYLAYLTTTGNFVATGAITAGSASDARLKTNIQSLSAEAAKRIVMALNPVTFTWNEKATELFDQYKGDDLGMIAQEVEPYLPQAVGTIFEKYKRLDYTKVISPLVKVAQDHESRIRQLEAENRELRKRLNMN